MRPWIFALLCAPILTAQTASLADLDRARADVSRLEALVREGAIASNRLARARLALEDAEDEAILRKTLFGPLTAQDLTRLPMDDLIQAARRRVERFESRLREREQLVEQGVAARSELEPLREELELRGQTLRLAFSRAETVGNLLQLMRAEEAASRRAEEARSTAPAWKPVERFEGNGKFELAMLRAIEEAFEKRFQSPLPVSAKGMTEVHRAFGFDHTNRVDVKLNPDSEEGIWLRRFLEQAGIPYFAFRTFIPGSATGAHIHVGPPSLRLAAPSPKS